jgi:hypothetical protein
MNKGEGMEIAILHLAKKENNDKEFDFYSMSTQLLIPDEIQKYVFQTLFHSSFINGPATIDNPIIRITEKGLQYAEELKEKYYLNNNKPLNPTNTQEMLIEDSCEILFQMHKNDSYNHLWTKNSYDNNPINLSVAKEILIYNKILFQNTLNNGKVYTNLNPDFYHIATCKEALDINADQKKLQSGLLIDNRITTHGDNSPASHSQLSYNQSNNPETTKTKWYQKWADEFVKNIVQYVFFISVSLITGVGIGKSCNLSPSQAKSQLSDPKFLQSSLDSNNLKK